MKYGKVWQKCNNLLRRSFNPVNAEKYYDTNVLWSNRLLHKLLENPENFYQDAIEYANSHCSLYVLFDKLEDSYVSSNIVLIAYGHEGEDISEHLLTQH